MKNSMGVGRNMSLRAVRPVAAAAAATNIADTTRIEAEVAGPGPSPEHIRHPRTKTRMREAGVEAD